MSLKNRLANIVVLLVLMPNAHGQTLIDDFHDGDDEGWTQYLISGQGGTFDPTTGEYNLSTPDLVPVGTFGGISAYWDESIEPHFVEGLWRVTARANSEGTGVGVMLRGDPSLGVNGYLINTSMRGRFQLRNCTGGSCPTIAASNPGLFTLEDDWVIEAGVIDDQITVKAWLEGDPIPDEPLLTYFDDSHAAGQFGVVAFIGLNWPEPARVDATFDDVYFISDEPIAGDYNRDGTLDDADLDLQAEAINDPNPDFAKYDENLDGIVDFQDRLVWVRDHFGSWIGDSNLDGEFNSGDLVAVFEAGHYEDGFAMNSGWAQGDWNGDGDFASGDLVAAFHDGGFEQGPLEGVKSIPEPSSHVMLIAGLISIVIQSSGRTDKTSKV